MRYVSIFTFLAYNGRGHEYVQVAITQVLHHSVSSHILSFEQWCK